MSDTHDSFAARSVWPTIGFDLVTLRIFAAAAEERSFGGAATRESLSLSAVSRRISDLEARFGITLFDRHDRGVTLTSAGEALLAHLRNVFTLFERMVLDMEAFREGARGCIRIQAHMSAASSIFPRVLARFLDGNPGIDVDVQEHVSLDVVHALQTGMADLGLISGSIPTGDLHTFPWHEDQLVAVVSTKNDLAGSESVTLADLASYPFIVMQRDTALLGLYREQLRMLGLPFRDRVHAASSASICKMVSAGLGVAILPSTSVDAQDKTLQMVAVELKESWARRPLMLCVRKPDQLAMATRLLLDFLIENRPLGRNPAPEVIAHIEAVTGNPASKD
jgi:DNA-binding transcriptional LysR family regulator